MAHRMMIAFAALLLASPAFAEVADKEPSAGVLWAWALGLNVAAILLALLRPWLALLVAPIAALSAWGIHSELSDPFVGPAILEELGSDYVILGYVSGALGLLGPLIIFLLSSRARRRSA